MDQVGNAAIIAGQSKPVAMHAGSPSFLTGFKAGLPDAFVVGSTELPPRFRNDCSAACAPLLQPI